jgi:uncharacterized membrane protein YdbT with pleckstrin-like domain
MLYFETGTLRTDAQQVPIRVVMDVDVKQSMVQKSRGVGDVIVHIERTGGAIEKVTDRPLNTNARVSQGR